MSSAANTESTDVTADIAISDAARYLKQLCRHFGHKVTATFDDATGLVEFDGATASLHATTPELLRITIHGADSASTVRYADVVERHLVKFAFRETLVVVWNELDATNSNDVRTVSHP